MKSRHIIEGRRIIVYSLRKYVIQVLIMIGEQALQKKLESIIEKRLQEVFNLVGNQIETR